MREQTEELGWCPHCRQVTFHTLRSESGEGFDLDEVANALANASLKESLGEPLTTAEANILAFTRDASRIMENRYGTYVPEEDDG
jgi:hypothetical protein